MVSDSVTTRARKRCFPPGWPQNVEGNACRSLPHTVPCADVTKNWQRALETAKRCTKHREVFFAGLYETPRARFSRPPHLLLPGGAPPASTSDLPFATPSSPHAHTRAPQLGRATPHPRHDAGTLRSGPAGCPASAPCRVPAASRTRRDPVS